MERVFVSGKSFESTKREKGKVCFSIRNEQQKVFFMKIWWGEIRCQYEFVFEAMLISFNNVYFWIP